MKKLVSIVMALALILCACSAAFAETTPVKAGFIFLHDENSTYDLNFINGAKAACEKLGIEPILKTGIPEGQECYEAAMDLVDAGCMLDNNCGTNMLDSFCAFESNVLNLFTRSAMNFSLIWNFITFPSTNHIASSGFSSIVAAMSSL